ncbi:MAG TPA: mechanosensitive ion channel family protein [Hyphomonadaceae bacterium]|nr:mechanosensitive ion channel family protein [Hyphomonadaceae bacterium]
MDFQQQFEAFRTWALDFGGASQKWMWSAIALIGAYVLGVIVSAILRFFAVRLVGLAKHKKDEEKKTADHLMIDILGLIVRACFILFALAIAANLLFGYGLDQAQALAISALKGLAILVGVWFIGSWLSGRVRRFGEKVGRRAAAGGQTLFHFLSALVRFGAFAIGLIAALQQFGFPIASLVAVIGAAGLAIALALQDTLKAVAAGVIIAIFRPYRIGDVVQISGETGTVADITPFTTVLSTIDNKEVVVTNDKAWGGIIVNHTARSLRRVDLLFSIDYDDDIDKAIGIIQGVLSDDPRARDEPPVWVNVVELASSSVDLRARAWCASSDWWELRCDVIKKVKQAFDREGITIPYPHQVEISKYGRQPATFPDARPQAKASNE